MFSFAFFIYVFVASFTPGPNNIMAMSSANLYGFRKTRPFIFGVAAGFLIVMLICSYFNVMLHAFIPRIQFWMNLLGCVYMTYLALKIMRSRTKDASGQQQQANSFLTGAILQFVNPKGILYGITAVSTFIIPFYNSSVAVLVAVSVFMAFVAVLSTSCWAMFGSLFKRFLSRYEKPFNIAMGMLLIYGAVSIYV
ncbi:MAG: lysE type translocator family protein [Paenibacillaceae bacterium]|jgi:threonine/homoserine/homoserine lactone efflux protein|nr:lysE type translocator family protein [Paenibacillaceae bacterium]